MYWSPPDEVLIKIGNFLVWKNRRQRVKAHKLSSSYVMKGRKMALYELQVSTSFSWNQILGEELTSHLLHGERLKIMNHAASNGYTATALQLLRGGWHPDWGNVLHRAVRDGQLGVAVALLQWRADANLKESSGRGRTPLHMAAQRVAEHTDWHLHNVLLDYGADLSAQDSQGKTPADLVQETSLSAAASDGDTEAILSLLTLRCDPNATGSFWQRPRGSRKCLSPLYLAVQEHHSDAIRVLLASGADTSIDQPLRLAVFRGDQEIVNLLLDARANPSLDPIDSDATPSDWGRGPFEAVAIAVYMGHASVTQLFLDAGIVSDTTPLLLSALERNHRDVVAVLLNARADPNASVSISLLLPSTMEDQYGVWCCLPGVPLNKVCYNPELMQLLLEARADPNLAHRFHELEAAKMAEWLSPAQYDFVEWLSPEQISMLYSL